MLELIDNILGHVKLPLCDVFNSCLSKRQKKAPVRIKAGAFYRLKS